MEIYLVIVVLLVIVYFSLAGYARQKNKNHKYRAALLVQQDTLRQINTTLRDGYVQTVISSTDLVLEN